MLDEAQRAARLEHTPNLGQSLLMSGIVHIVQVERALSKLSSSNGSDWPSRPDRSTGMLDARRRLAASFQPSVGRLHRRNPPHRLRVERDIEARAETDLDDLPLEPVADALRSGSVTFIPQATLIIRGRT